jgi:hypothetical protein
MTHEVTPLNGVTASGDGSTTTFALSHGLSTTPSVAHVTPASRAASTDFWKTNLTSSAVEIEFARAPPSGTDNLAFDLILVH